MRAQHVGNLNHSALLEYIKKTYERRQKVIDPTIFDSVVTHRLVYPWQKLCDRRSHWKYFTCSSSVNSCTESAIDFNNKLSILRKNVSSETTFHFVSLNWFYGLCVCVSVLQTVCAYYGVVNRDINVRFSADIFLIKSDWIIHTTNGKSTSRTVCISRYIC